MLTEDKKRNEARGSCSKRDVWIARAQRIEAAVVQETWLPIGLRSLLVSDISQVMKYLKRGYRERAWRTVHRLALMSFRYGPELLDSEAVAQLRVLDLELGAEGDPLFPRKHSLMSH